MLRPDSFLNLSCLWTFCVLNIPRYFYFASQQWDRDIEIRPLVGGLMSESVHPLCSGLWAQYRLQFLPNYFQTSHVSCWWWEEEPYWFWATVSKVKVNFGTLCINLVGTIQTTVLVQSVSNVDDERRNPIDFGYCSSRSRSTFELCLKPYGFDTGYSFSPCSKVSVGICLVSTIQTTVFLINFKLHM